MHNGIHTDKQVETLAIAASGDEIRRACEWLTTALRQRDVPDPQVECLELALHEVLANVLAHGGSAARAEPIRIRIEVREKATTGEARVKVTGRRHPVRPDRRAGAHPGKNAGRGAARRPGLAADPALLRLDELPP